MQSSIQKIRRTAPCLRSLFLAAVCGDGTAWVAFADDVSQDAISEGSGDADNGASATGARVGPANGNIKATAASPGRGHYEKVFLSDMPPHSQSTNAVVHVGQALQSRGQVPQVGGKETHKSLALETIGGEVAYVTYSVPKGATVLKGVATVFESGADKGRVAAAPSLIFSVRGDKGESLWQSARAASKPGEAFPFSVRLKGREYVTLAIELRGSTEPCTSVWLDPVFEVDIERNVRLGVGRLGLWTPEARAEFTQLCKKNGWPPCQDRGVLVTELNAVHSEGLQVNDIILRINGKSITTEASKVAAFDTLRLGKEVTVVLKRVTAENPNAWATHTVTTMPVSESAIKEAEAEKLKKKAEALLSVKLRVRSTGEFMERREMLSRNEEVYAALGELKDRLKPQDVSSQPVVSGMLQLTEASEALEAGRQSFQRYLSDSSRTRADGGSGRLTLTRAILRTPLKDLLCEINGEVWTAKELWEYCEASYR